MSNLWGFLLQTTTATVVALLLLGMKAIFLDKLSPRWQYGIWSVLALRILLPVQSAKWVFFPLPFWLETLKGTVEQGVSSAFTEIFQPILVTAPFPVLSKGASSVTDWLFVVYAIGVFVSLLWYAVSYFRLRMLLRHATSVDVEMEKMIHHVCETYGLRACKAVMISGLPSAFVCGVIRPVLVLPKDVYTDEKVLLHELLHLRYGDVLQTVFWCVLRSLHWCNPVLQYAFCRIGNDMESLCDQRVLERLEGEERREYGAILLAMSNARYPRAVGTSSISNGGANIARRITAIVHFKKYPKGMALVSVCIAVVLAVPVLAGTEASYDTKVYQPIGAVERNRAMAMARLNRCTTVAGALDTFAKALLYGNGVSLAMASPLGMHAEIMEEMQANEAMFGENSYQVSVGDELAYISINDGYEIYNLRLQEDGSYTALLVFVVSAFENPEGEGLWRNAEGLEYAGKIIVPVKVWKEDDWVVAEQGERVAIRGANLALPLVPTEKIESLFSEEQTGESGSVLLEVRTEYIVSNDLQEDAWHFFHVTTFDATPRPQAEFDVCRYTTLVTYTYGGSEEARENLTYAYMGIVALATAGEEPDFTPYGEYGNGGWSSSNGSAGDGMPVTAQWNGQLISGSGTDVEMKNGMGVLPEAFAVRIVWNKEAVEDFVFQGVS